MALKELHKTNETKPVKVEKQVDEFISKGGTLAKPVQKTSDDNHRLTLRMPQWLLEKIDVKRKERVGKISRNLWILETIEKAARD